MNSNNSIIEFKNVSKHYPYYHHITGGLKHFLFNIPKAIKTIKEQKHQALENISFEIKEGECVAFIGRNGAGKSTLLGLIAGVLKANQGEVIVRKRVSPLLELGGGFHPELTGVDNIKMNGVLLGLTRQQVKNKIDEIIEFSELKDFIFHPIRTYSSGMMARLGFSVIAHLEPELLLIDEILAVGDASFQKKCFNKMMEFKNKNITMVFVSHSAPDIVKICEKTIWIENKVIKKVGPSQEVVDAYLKEVQ
jgi:lipopolysaccharide transport system ATP-binding protein